MLTHHFTNISHFHIHYEDIIGLLSIDGVYMLTELRRIVRTHILEERVVCTHPEEACCFGFDAVL
jgi:hypothetical protein